MNANMKSCLWGIRLYIIDLNCIDLFTKHAASVRELGLPEKALPIKVTPSLGFFVCVFCLKSLCVPLV